MIKSAHFMSLPAGASLPEVLQHWYEVHGKLHVGPTTLMSSYLQHQTLISAYGGSTNPTHVGASIVEYKDLETMKKARETPAWRAAAQDSIDGLNGRPTFGGPSLLAIGEEKMLKDGPTTPTMVKAITIVRWNPELPEDEVREFWATRAGPTAAKLPGLRRYVQNHGVKAVRNMPGVTHDSWNEMWFDDINAYMAAHKSPEAEQMRKTAGSGLSGRPIFDPASRGFVIGRARQMMPIK